MRQEVVSYRWRYPIAVFACCFIALSLLLFPIDLSPDTVVAQSTDEDILDNWAVGDPHVHCEISWWDLTFWLGFKKGPSPDDQIRSAKDHGLDWLIFTDHDGMFNPKNRRNLDQWHKRCVYYDEWVSYVDKYNDDDVGTPQVIFGEELGSCVPGISHGHFLTYLWGKPSEPIFWETDEGTRSMLDKVKGKGFGFLAHPLNRHSLKNFFPFLDGDAPFPPLICDWSFLDDTAYHDVVAGFEIMNHPDDRDDMVLLNIYDSLLSKGRRFFLISGGDAHSTEKVGRSHTWVRVPSGQRTDTAILEALRNGHSVVSQRDGPVVFFQASRQGDVPVQIGDQLLVNNNDVITLDISWLGKDRPQPSDVKIVAPFEVKSPDGKPCQTLDRPDQVTSVDIQVPEDFETTSDGIGFIRLECSTDGKQCYTNPVFIRAKSSSGAATSTAMVFDVSGSMSETTSDGEVKISAAKESADLVLRMIGQNRKSGRAPENDLVALATFSDYSTLELDLTEDLQAAAGAVDGLSPQNSTNLGAGIEEGSTALSYPSASGTQKIMILLSDGMNNTGMTNQEILSGPVQGAKNAGTKIFTVGFGDPSNLDEELLKQIATETGGTYYPAENAYLLNQLYADLRLSAVGPSLGSFDGSVGQGQVKTAGNIEVPTGTQELHGLLMWPGSKLDFDLKDPGGKTVDASYPGANLFTDDVPVYYIITDPAAGSWTVAVAGEDVPGGSTDFHASFAARPAPATLPVDWAAITSEGISLDNLKAAIAGLEKRDGDTSKSGPGGELWIFLTLGMLVLLGAAAFGIYRLRVGPAATVAGPSGTCPSCGEKTGLNWIRCGFCGTPLAGTPSRKQASPGVGATPAPEPVATTVSLVIEKGPGAGGAYVLSSSQTSIGRGKNNDIVIEDKEVSSSHARISIARDGISLEDLNSTNGTLVNEQLVSSCRLKDGDTIEIGETVFRLEHG